MLFYLCLLNHQKSSFFFFSALDRETIEHDGTRVLVLLFFFFTSLLSLATSIVSVAALIGQRNALFEKVL